MRKIFVSLILLHVVHAGAQQLPVEKSNGLKKQLIPDSTVLRKLEDIRDSALLRNTLPDAEEIKRSVSRSGETILEFQREQDARQKKAALVRIAIGAGFLVLLIIGLLRRRKK